MMNKPRKMAANRHRNTLNRKNQLKQTGVVRQHCVTQEPAKSVRHKADDAINEPGNSQVWEDQDQSKTQALSPKIVTIVDAIVDQDGIERIAFQKGSREALIEHGDFALEGKVGLQKLRNAGLYVFGRYEAKALLEQVSEITEFRQQMVIKKVGWSAPHYTMMDGEPISPQGVPKPPVIFSTEPAKVASAGTVKGFKRWVLRPLTGHPIGEVVACAALAPILMEVLAVDEGFGLNVWGASSRGKSTLGLIQAAFWGPVRKSRDVYWYSLNATREGIQKVVPSHNDGLLVLDELGLLGEGSRAASDLFNIILRLSGGRGRLKAGPPRETSPLSLLSYYISSNVDLERVLAGLGREKMEAASVRLLGVRVRRRKTGFFERTPRGFASSAAAVKSIKRSMAENHGVAARAFAQAVVQARADDEASLVRGLELRMEQFRRRAGAKSASPQQQRVIDIWALIAATGLYAQHQRILPKRYKPMESALACFHAMDDLVNPTRSITDRLRAWLQANDYYDLRITDLPALSYRQMATCGIFIAHGKKRTTEVQIVKELFEKIFPDYRQILGSPEGLKVMVVNAGDSYQTRRKVRRGHNPEKVYVFSVPADIV